MRTGFPRIRQLVDGAKPTGSEAVLSGRESPLATAVHLCFAESAGLGSRCACRTRCTPGLSPQTSPRRRSRGWTCPTTGSTQHTPPPSSRTGSASPTANAFSASRASTNHRRRPSSSTAASSTPTRLVSEKASRLDSSFRVFSLSLNPNPRRHRHLQRYVGGLRRSRRTVGEPRPDQGDVQRAAAPGRCLQHAERGRAGGVERDSGARHGAGLPRADCGGGQHGRPRAEGPGCLRRRFRDLLRLHVRSWRDAPGAQACREDVHVRALSSGSSDRHRPRGAGRQDRARVHNAHRPAADLPRYRAGEQAAGRGAAGLLPRAVPQPAAQARIAGCPACPRRR